MKNTMRCLVIIAFVTIMGLTFAAPVHAGGIVDRVFNGGAKSMAKQVSDLTKKAADLEKKAAELQVKAAEIEEKAAALSDRDRGTFREELARLSFEPPEWLFNDAPGMLTNAGDGGGTGGDTGSDLVGIIRGLFGGGGNNSSPSAGGSTTAPSSGGTSSPTTAPSGNILGARTGAFFNIFDGKNYHMKTKTNFEGMEVISETYIKGDMVATVSEAMGMASRSVQRDNMTYVINDAARMVMVFPRSASSGNPSEEPVRTAGMVVTGSGTARFDGRNLPYEEYSLVGDSSVKLQFFLDGNNLAGFRAITSQMTIDMVVLALDQNVPNSVFEIPAGYQRMEMP